MGDQLEYWRRRAIENSDERVRQNFNLLLKRQKTPKALIFCLIMSLLVLTTLCLLLGYELKQPEIITQQIIRPMEIINYYPVEVINITTFVDNSKLYEADEICEYIDILGDDGTWSRKGTCKKIE